jgi:hypothetical protein
LRVLAAMLVFAFGCQRGRVPPDLGPACSQGAPRLSDGGCPVICNADRFSCEGQIADVCDPSGTIHTRTDCAAQGAQCVVRPLTAQCEKQECVPSSTFCSPDGKEVRKCSQSGQSSELVQTCDDPDQRGNQCAGSVCRDRCTLLEAQDRSTLGCRFMFAATAPSPSLLLLNPQPDLPATVVIRAAGAVVSSLTLGPGQSQAAPLGNRGLDGSSTALADQHLEVTSTLPLLVVLATPNQTTAIPENALSSRYLVPLTDFIAITATLPATQVSLTPAAATSAGTGLPSVPAGGTLTATLERGRVLAVGFQTRAPGSRITASAPVSLIYQASASTGSAFVPGADTLGRDAVVPAQGGTLLAREAASVVTERDGTIQVAAGGTASLTPNQRVSSTAPMLLVALSSGTPQVVPPVEQWLKQYWLGDNLSLTLVATAPLTVTLPVGTSQLTKAAGNYAEARLTTATQPGLLSASSAFLPLADGSRVLGQSLAIIAP